MILSGVKYQKRDKISLPPASAGNGQLSIWSIIVNTHQTSCGWLSDSMTQSTYVGTMEQLSMGYFIAEKLRVYPLATLHCNRASSTWKTERNLTCIIQMKKIRNRTLSLILYNITTLYGTKWDATTHTYSQRSMIM